MRLRYSLYSDFQVQDNLDHNASPSPVDVHIELRDILMHIYRNYS